KQNRLSTTAMIGKMVDDHWQAIRTAPERGEKVAWCTGPLFPFAYAMGIKCHFHAGYCAYAGGRHAAPWLLDQAENEGHLPESCSYHRMHMGVIKTDVEHTEIPENIRKYVLPIPDLILLMRLCTEHSHQMDSINRLLRYTIKKEVPVIAVDCCPAHNVEDIPHEVEFLKRQVKEDVIPALEKFCGKPFDYNRLSELVAEIKATCTLRNDCVELMKHVPAPASNFDLAVSMAPTFYLLGSPGNTEYYHRLKVEMEERIAKGISGMLPEEKYRIYFDGWMLWGFMGWFARKLVSYGANMIVGRYAPLEFFQRPDLLDPDNPVDTIIEQHGYFMRYGMPEVAIDLIPEWVKDFSIDGMIMHNSRTCRLWNLGQEDIIQEVEKRYGVPGLLMEADMIDPRFFSEAQLDTRLGAFFEMIDGRRKFRRG
ncbi:MAG: 2-hydroxyacyl-CoA dehydratase family protein, partial [Chloroflexota bacterium]|nr:2-hydroxyacyl-CoA dehydratase family protein [Chloroflexota bacterium]